MDAQPDPGTAYKEFSAGFACFAGRPNVGKSTLMNALVGSKVDHEQQAPDDRRVIRGTSGVPTPN